MAIVDRLTCADDFTNALDDLAEEGIGASGAGRVIDLTKAVPDPLLAALRALALTETAVPLAIRAASGDGQFVNVLWRPPDIVVLRSPKPGAVWARHYKYPSGRRVGIDIRFDGKLDSDREVATFSAKEPLPPIAHELFAVTGLDHASPPG